MQTLSLHPKLSIGQNSCIFGMGGSYLKPQSLVSKTIMLNIQKSAILQPFIEVKIIILKLAVDTHWR